MALSHSPSIVTNGLVLCLDAANRRSYPGSGTTWTDLSGNGNNGTLTNGPTFSSANGGSVVFDGNDDYGSVSCSQFQSGNNPLTMEVWFRWFGNGTNTLNIIYGYGNDIGGNRVPNLAVVSNLVQFNFGSNTGVVNSSIIQTNTWYQAIGIYDLSTCKIYLNGFLSNTTSYSSAAIELNGSNGQTAGIGCLFSQYGNVGTGATKRYGTFNGNISLVRYYNRSLTALEVLQNYNATRGRFL